MIAAAEPLRITLENAFVRLEPIEERHREFLRAAGDDPDIWRFAGVSQHNSNFDAWMEDRLSATAHGRDLTFVIFDKASGGFGFSLERDTVP